MSRILKLGVIGVGAVLGGLITLVLVLLLAASSINSLARWNAKRVADVGSESIDSESVVGENLLIIGTDGEDAVGFLALRADPDEERVYGIAVHKGTFMQIPGIGYDEVGVSLASGAQVSMDTISNFIGVPFDQYVVVEGSAYQSALQEQDLSQILDTVLETDMSLGDVGWFAEVFDATPSEGVAIVPLQTRPITLGDQTYFEPVAEEVADIVLSWWGVGMGTDKDRLRIIVYNGSGVPGIAGEAARQLIQEGFRVVETRNADSFDHETTLIYLYHGELIDAERVREVIGVGEVLEQEANQDVADIIVIIGEDYASSVGDG